MKTKKEIKRKKMEELTPKEMQSINGGAKYVLYQDSNGNWKIRTE